MYKSPIPPAIQPTVTIDCREQNYRPLMPLRWRFAAFQRQRLLMAGTVRQLR